MAVRFWLTDSKVKKVGRLFSTSMVRIHVKKRLMANKVSEWHQDKDAVSTKGWNKPWFDNSSVQTGTCKRISAVPLMARPQVTGRPHGTVFPLPLSQPTRVDRETSTQKQATCPGLCQPPQHPSDPVMCWNLHSKSRPGSWRWLSRTNPSLRAGRTNEAADLADVPSAGIGEDRVVGTAAPAGGS